jgi:uncharacterized phage protein (TIGR02220 family)
LIPKEDTTYLVGQQKEQPRLPAKLPYSEIVSYLNEKVGSQFKPTTDTTKNLIRARWAEGFKIEDFRLVIDHKTDEWKTDAKMLQYLRPKTLFGTNFEGYLQVARSNCGNYSGGRTKCERCAYNKIEKCRNLSKEDFDPSKCNAFVPG